MHGTEISNMKKTGLKTPERNRYFYGKLLDVYHFELETNYLNAKRWLLNRLVSGYGVVCGLDVQLCKDEKSIIVLPGFAIDKWGREIIVPESSKPVKLPDVPAQKSETPKQEPCDEDNFVHVCICFLECESDPMPVLAGDCKTVELCAPGAIRERYKVVIKEGKSPEVHTECSIPDVISGDQIDYRALARWITEECPCLPDDPCVPLANVPLPVSGVTYDPNDIDITIRPIVYTNDLLFELILALMRKERGHPRGGKP